jgi:hypothetical protein
VCRERYPARSGSIYVGRALFAAPQLLSQSLSPPDQLPQDHTADKRDDDAG